MANELTYVNGTFGQYFKKKICVEMEIGFFLSLKTEIVTKLTKCTGL
jgi:hypothetical protein